MLETTQPYWPLNDITCVTKVQLLRQNVPDLNLQKFALEEQSAPQYAVISIMDNLQQNVHSRER